MSLGCGKVCKTESSGLEDEICSVFLSFRF